MAKTEVKKTSSSTAKKSAPKTTSKSSTTTQASAAPAVEKKAPVKIRKKYLIAALVFVVLGFLVYTFRSVFVAAVVNGYPVSRLEVVREAEKQNGKQVLNTVIRNTLIEQEAKKQHVTVSEKEVTDEIKKVEANLSKQGQKLDQVLAMQGMTKEDLRKLIRLDKLVGKMVGKDVKISDKEVDEYLEANKDSLPEDQDPAQLRKAVRTQLQQQQLNQKVRLWLDNLQSKAKIIYFVQY